MDTVKQTVSHIDTKIVIRTKLFILKAVKYWKILHSVEAHLTIHKQGSGITYMEDIFT